MAVNTVSIAPLLNQLRNLSSVSEEDIASDIASALALVFENRLDALQCGSLLTRLDDLGKDQDPLVLAKTATRMREAAAQVDRKALKKVIHKRALRLGGYHGGLCDIVGTGGDGHSTFNVSTTASILASSLLLMSKHGNRASSSTSGSADLLQSVKPKGPNIEAITSTTLVEVYEKTNYAFLFAPKFHPAMRHVAPIRKSLGFRTIFNLLGPLANPVEGDIEARIVGVAEHKLGNVFAEALRLTGARKAMVVCGGENLDEISCARETNCWRLVAVSGTETKKLGHQESIVDGEEPTLPKVVIEEFKLSPADFGLLAHPLSTVAGGRLPHENAEILMQLLRNELPPGDPVLDFVLINTAALFAVSGVCDADGDEVITDRGPGGLRWIEGVRRARWAMKSGEALRSLTRYIEATHSFDGQ